MARTVDVEKYAHNRQHVLDCAAALFAKRGYERTTTALICSQAGISPGKLYHYFTSKKQVFLAVLSQDEQDTKMLLESLVSDPDPLEALLAYVAHLAEPAAAHPMVPQLVLEAMLQAHRDPEVRQELERVDQGEKEGIRLLMRRAADADQIGRSLAIDHAASWISAMVSAVYLNAALDPDFDAAGHIPQLVVTVRAFLAVS
ncbi:TetR/AcrR family transcriptional regulator [Nesterenkonia haasae]|uniref:TetR/AcrR family transcriptional regulator n=1 Tax=Nesterenkonia haasae TaxID=2587813 RepID=UPI0013917CE1|nr:TetR/AcrR family transcriptional regulator [Nesterenkonia haasae]NDK31019.1 TetR/AcrR family transcriptional regulator [Nesterenkonia haasae]